MLRPPVNAEDKNEDASDPEDLNLDLLAPDLTFIKPSDLPEFFKDTQNNFLFGARIN